MNTNKILLESAVPNKMSKQLQESVEEFTKSCVAMNHPFFTRYVKNYEKHLQETTEPEMGALRGQTVGDASGASSNMQVAATLEIFNAVIRGYTRYMEDTFVKKYTTESTTFKIPLTEYKELAANISAGELPHSEKKIDYAVVDLSTPESEKGAKITWTRSLLEDVTFDIQAEMAEGLGFAIAKLMMQDIITKLDTCVATSMPAREVIDSSNPIVWTEFLAVIGAVDTGILQTDKTYKTYGPADYCLVSPDLYWQLLNIIQLTNVLYEGSTDPIRNGVIKLALGTTIVKESLLPAGVMYAVNSQKAIAMVTRRVLKIEPVVFPSWNEYGFIGTVRYGTTLIFSGAIQKASFTGS